MKNIHKSNSEKIHLYQYHNWKYKNQNQNQNQTKQGGISSTTFFKQTGLRQIKE